MKNKIQVYLAGSMFCEADRMYNALLAEKIRERVGNYIDLYVPQENLSINDKTKCASSIDIFWGDYNRLQNTDIFIARIDGDIPPSGTSAEIGIMSQRRQNWEHKLHNFQANYYLAYGKHATEKEIEEFKHVEGFEPMIIGLCTDSRNPKRTYLEAKNELMRNADYESQYCYFNLFTLGCIKVNGKLATSIDELVSTIESAVKMRLGRRYEIRRTKEGRF
jgi:nucleoside 2-deoxyribosyltransferase